MANRIQLRRDTTANWENTNPVLADGEMGYDIVTNEIRIGDGSTSWTGLTANTISGGGGGASTGNVTFNDFTIIGTGNIHLQPDDQDSSHLDVFLTGGSDVHVTTDAGHLILGGDGGANVRLANDGNVQIQSYGASAKTWTFNSNGNVILPLGGTIGETADDYSILLTPYAEPQYNPDMAVKIYPTMFDDDHIHITAGNVATVDLYLGDDDQYVKIEKNAGNVVIGTGVVGVPNAVDNVSTPNGGWNGAGPSENLATTGGTGTGLRVTVSGFEGGYASTVSIVTPGTGYTVGDSMTVVGGESDATFTISGVTSSPSVWKFGTDGTLTLPRGGGDGGDDEGAEIVFTTATNSSLSGNAVVVDQYVNKFRFFEAGGSNRGAYIDLTYGAPVAGTLLNNRVSGFVNAGANVIMDSLKATVTTSDQRGLSLAATTGSFTARVAGTYANTAGTGGSMTNSISITTTPSASLFGWDLVIAGDMATYIITDITNGRAYRVTMQIGDAFDNNMISIERLV